MAIAESARREKRICVGVFDSGVGGLSVVRSLCQQMPEARLVYVADAAYAPYGDRDEGFVRERSRKMVEHLLNEGAQVVVMACNTATAVAAEAVRREHPGLLIVGVEPGIKPAVAATRNGRIGVMATALTLVSPRFRDLVARHGQGVELTLQACSGLADCIEDAAQSPEPLATLIERYAAPLRDAAVDTVVLGCTHYPLVATQIQAALGPGIQLIDTSEAVARQIQRLADRAAPLLHDDSPRLCLWTTDASHPSLLAAARRWLSLSASVQLVS